MCPYRRIKNKLVKLRVKVVRPVRVLLKYSRWNMVEL